MTTMPDATHYTYRVAWSPEDGEHVVTVAEFPSLSWLAPTQVEALRGIADVVRDVLADLAAVGDPIPEPLSERTYSGRFVVRVPAEVHRRLAREAAEQHVSLNRLVSDRLARALSRARANPPFGALRCGDPVTVVGVRVRAICAPVWCCRRPRQCPHLGLPLVVSRGDGWTGGCRFPRRPSGTARSRPAFRHGSRG